jgi:hypothetical protein
MLTNGRMVTEVGFYGGGPLDLLVTLGILLESVPVELQLIMESFKITQSTTGTFVWRVQACQP